MHCGGGIHHMATVQVSLPGFWVYTLGLEENSGAWWQLSYFPQKSVHFTLNVQFVLNMHWYNIIWMRSFSLKLRYLLLPLVTWQTMGFASALVVACNQSTPLSKHPWQVLMLHNLTFCWDSGLSPQALIRRGNMSSRPVMLISRFFFFFQSLARQYIPD